MILKCKDGKTISGKLDSHEEKGPDSLFALTDYVIVYPENENGVIEKYDAREYGFKTAVVVKLQDIETFQIFNGERKKHRVCIGKSREKQAGGGDVTTEKEEF